MSLVPQRMILCAAVAGALLSVTRPIPAAAATRVVLIDQMKYGTVPPLRVGDEVLFLNKDIFRHTVTATNDSFNLDLEPGGRGGLRINSAGHAAFYCKYHPGMRGSMSAK